MSNIETRQSALVDACVAGIHAHQIALHRTTGQGAADRFTFSGTDAELTVLTTAWSRLLTERPDDLRAWLAGTGEDPSPLAGDDDVATVRIDRTIRRLREAPLVPAADLPFSVLVRALTARAPDATPAAIGAVASLHQVVLQTSLDALEVQQLFPLYLWAQLPVSLDQLGLAHDEAALIAFGRELAPPCAPCPFDVSPEAWHLVLRKIQNWSERFRGKVTAATYAQELLALPAIRDCAGPLRLLPPQKICVLGHSFTMSMHWCSQGSFTDIACEIIRHHNPRIEWVRVNRGGLTPTLARRDYLETVLQHHPDQTIMVTIARNAENRADLRYCIRKLLERGSKVIVFDCVMVYPEIYATEKLAAAEARDAGATVVEVYPLLAAHPERESFPALDGVHTAPPYHKFMAQELVKFFAGRRQAALPSK